MRKPHLSSAIFFVMCVSVFCQDALWAKPVTAKTARKVAANYINKTNQVKAIRDWEKGQTHKAADRIQEADFVQIHTASQNGSAVYYVFNLSPQGWAIISADDVAWPVIGYSEIGAYDPNELTQPPAFVVWMDSVAAQIADAASKGLAPLPKAASAWNELSVAPDSFAPDLAELALSEAVAPLIQSSWGQGTTWEWSPPTNSSYNKYCPWEYSDWTHTTINWCPTGCTATAMAQIMRYWQWPTVGFGSHSYDPTYSCSHECSGFGVRSVDFGAQTYDWNAMPLNGASTAIASLMRDIGVAVEMDYTPTGSSAWPGNAFQDYFRYQTGSLLWKEYYSDVVWISKLKTDLDAGRPLWYYGNGSGAHAFICDGYDTSNNFHFNWGWDGSYNGWFVLNDLTPGSHNYTSGQGALFGIQPLQGVVYVDDDYAAGGANDGYVWDKTAFSSIQRAIACVSSGSIVHVAAGYYVESVDLGGKTLHLYAPDGPNATTIYGNNALHVIKCAGGQGPDTIIEGFSITGGNAAGTSAMDRCGGGMCNWYSSPTVINCSFYENAANLHGGGMHNEHASPTLINCFFYGNSAGAHGGGLMNNYDFVSTVVNCVFANNTAGSGGGGCCNCVSSPRIVNCTFSGNTASAYGSGTYNYYSTATITNCIYWGDTNNEIVNSSSTSYVTYSDVQGGYVGQGNINADPMFNLLLGDYSVKFTSPCLDAGSNAAIPGDITHDHGGYPRFVDACKPDSGSGTPPVVDMGAHEFQHTWSSVANLLTNPGFENGNASGWVTNWGFNVAAVAGQGHTGSYSGLAYNRTEMWQGAWQSLLAKVINGKTYRFSGWVRLQNAPSDYVELTFTYLDGSDPHYLRIDSATVYDNGWTFLNGTLAVAAQVGVNEPYLYFQGPAAGVNFYVDDVSVTEVMSDLDDSAVVDLLDFSLFARYYGLDCAVDDCGPANIEDCDRAVDEADLALFIADWLTGAI